MTLTPARFLSVPLALSVLFISGCQGVAPETLRRPSQEKVLHLVEVVKWKLGFWDVTLRPGDYIGKFESDGGIYYVGPSPCVFVTGKVGARPPEGQGWDCGIFVSHTNAAEPIVLMVNASNRAHTSFQSDGSPSFGAETPRTDDTPTTGTDSASLGAFIQSTVPQTTTSIGGAVGGAIGGALVESIIKAERGRFQDFKSQPSKEWLLRASAVAK
jgi:hypothetical protein